MITTGLFQKSEKDKAFWQNKYINLNVHIRSMGEAKRRKTQGLAPKSQKKPTSNPKKLLTKYPRLPLYLIGLFMTYLIFDWIKLNTAS